MKKLSLLIPILLAPFIVSCDNVEKDNSLIFTEFYNGDNINDRAIELTNITDNAIDLSNYKLCNYRYNTGLDEPSEEISLSGNLEPHHAYVICYDDASNEIKALSNLISEKLLNDGSFSISLKYKNKYIVDTIGFVGYEMNVARRCDLVRKQEHYFPRQNLYEEYDWIRYPFDDLSHLGNNECISETDLLKGPKLVQDNFNTPFCVDSTSGTGGTIKVSLNYCIDGDTTKFNFGYTYAAYGVSGSNSVRYFGINTPEIAHSYGETSDPYGDDAKEYTASLINNGKAYIVQSVKNSSLFERYGRVLGYVWVSNLVSPTNESYSLLSFQIVKQGLARVSFVTRNEHKIDDLKYNGIFYEEYLYNAQNYFATIIFSILYDL